jgi:alanyl-tRNA synthetase
VVAVYANLKQNNKRNLIILNQSAFYPTSGGQQHDTGKLTLEGLGECQVVDAIKVGKCVLHEIDKEVPEDLSLVGTSAHGQINLERRIQLLAHHTGTHLVFASCREVLGPHVWQAGAKKTTEQAHLDITHYKSLTREQELAIENNANRLISECIDIKKSMMDKAEAEKDFGFSLYQGGIVPGN